MDLMEPSTLTTKCPYKVCVHMNCGCLPISRLNLQGVANYYNVRLPTGQLVKDVVWYYDDPIVRCAAVAGHLAFYDEKVDVWVDGEKMS
jgi:uncharacterized protein (DUF427 family)